MVSFLLGLIHSIRRDRERRASARELLGFNDRLLRDIGLQRNQISDDGAGLFKPAKPFNKRQRPAATSHLRPSLQGCG